MVFSGVACCLTCICWGSGLWLVSVRSHPAAMPSSSQSCPWVTCRPRTGCRPSWSWGPRPPPPSGHKVLCPEEAERKCVSINILVAIVTDWKSIDPPPIPLFFSTRHCKSVSLQNSQSPVNFYLSSLFLGCRLNSFPLENTSPSSKRTWSSSTKANCV